MFDTDKTVRIVLRHGYDIIYLLYDTGVFVFTIVRRNGIIRRRPRTERVTPRLHRGQRRKILINDLRGDFFTPASAVNVTTRDGQPRLGRVNLRTNRTQKLKPSSK